MLAPSELRAWGRRTVLARRTTVGIGVALALILGSGPAQAADWKPKDTRRWAPEKLKKTDSVTGKNAAKSAAAAAASKERGDGTGTFKPRDVAWPAAGQAKVDLNAAPPAPPLGARFLTGARSAAPAAPVAEPSRAGSAPVWVEAADRARSGNAGPRTGKAAVTLADKKAAEKAGVQGLLLAVKSAEGTEKGAPVKVSVDVSHIAGAFGGDWLSRARLVELPECALITPDRPECQKQTPVATVKDGDRPGLLSAEVSLKADGPAADATRLNAAAGGATVLAASAAPGGSAGTYGATSLAPSGSWSQGGSTGGFSWTYPIDVPDGLGGTKPSISLSYSSQSVDGRTAATNNQASWIGEGWDYTPGFVERTFKPCSKDGQKDSGEQCLAGHNATISLNGKSSTLVRDDTSGTWRLENDDASKVEKLTGATNGDNNGEYWKVTTADGTQYYFGVGRKPGSSTAPATKSAWTTPVYGNNAGEECNKPTFDASWCMQAYRWNLDFVVDPRGGMITHWYDTATNYYKRGVSEATPTGTLTSYTRGGNLAKTTYGSKLTDADTVKPTAQVLFTTAERCLPDANFDCAPAKLTKANAAKWPDVPFDQNCASTGTCENYSATFWTTKRLTKITTQVLNGAGSGYDDVDSYAFTHEFPNPQDQTAPALWLASIQRSGHDGATKLTTPAITFTGRLMNNRVDSSGDNKPAMNRRRIVSVTAETGQVTDVGYADPDCTPGTGLPTSQDGNTTRCYPVYWNPDPKSPNDPTLDWFHKYVVNRVTEIDPFGGSRPQETRYEYVGGAAWHRDDEETTEDKQRTWNQFRGYEQVVTRAGTAPDVVSKSAAFYLRGMDGDTKADGSKRSATFTGIAGNTIKDSNPLAGSVRETQTFASDGGELVSVSQSEPWLSPVTATHSRGTKLPALTAQMLRSGSAKDKALRADKTWQSTSKTATFDNTYGMPVSVLDRADGLPDVCTTTSYARNTAAWMIDRVSETVQVQGDCATTASESNTLGRSRTYYDAQPHGTLTGAGQVTSTEELDRFEGGQPKFSLNSTVTYDAYGRVTTATDAAGAKTTTEYTPSTLFAPTSIKVTNAKNWSTTSTYHPLREVPVKVEDHNGRTSEQAIDALGRITAMWKPGRARSDAANQVIEYDLTNTGTSSVTTKTLRSDESYATSIEILDAFGQTIQTQGVTANGGTGRVISDMFYDSYGRPSKANASYFNNTSPEPVKTRFVANDNTVPGQTTVLYDGLGRPVTEIFSSKAIEQWRGTTAYPGVDRVDSTPPKGGTATSTHTDARGRSLEKRQYKSGTPTGEYDATRYAYDTEGQLTQVTDAAGNAWKYGYDLHGRQTRSEDPDKGTTTTAYDAADRPVSESDARGVTVFTSYDILGRPTSRNLGAVDGAKIATFDYDSLVPGLPTASTSWVDGKPWRQEVTGYDDAYHPIGSKLTVPAGEGALSASYSTSTYYDPITGEADFTDQPAAGGLPKERLYIGRNVNGLPTSVGTSTTTYVNFTDYDELGQVQRTTMGAVPKQVVFTNTNDQATGRLLRTTIDKEDAAGSVDITDYTYTPAGDVTSVSSQQGGVRDTQCFTYDHLRRMTRAWTDTGTTTTQPGPSVPGIGGCTNTAPQPGKVGGPAPYHQSFTYDVTGNRTSVTDHDPAGDAAKSTTTTNTFPAPGQPRPHAPTSTKKQTGSGPVVATNSTYDETGNTLTRPDAAGNTQTFTWTPDGNLASAKTSTGTSTYVYDAEGNRLARKDPGKTTLYLGSTELTLNTSTDTVTGNRYYSTPGGASIVRASNGTLSYVGADHHGTGTTAIGAATLQVQRQATKPFGEDRGAEPASWPGERGFVGGTEDKATGLTHLGAREYDTRTGTFLSVDPVIDPSDPQQLQGYLYANNSPMTFSDPDGLFWGAIKKAAKKVGGAVNKYGHTALDVAGMIPVIGEAADLVNGVWYAAQGDWKNAAMSFASMIPVAGAAIAGTRLGAKAVKYATKYTSRVSKASPVRKAAGWTSRSGPRAGAGKAGGGKAGWSSSGSTKKLWSGKGSSGAKPANSGSRRAASNPGCNAGNSFVPGTEILLADGTRKPIEQLKGGEKVLAADPSTGRVQAKEVTAVITGEGDKSLVEITVSTADGKTETVTATDKHPFWVPERGEWANAADLQPGQWLETSAGTKVQITEVRRHTKQQRVYNLSVDDFHTYYALAGSTPLLVHNCNVALGWQNKGKLDTWAREIGATTFSLARPQDFAQMAEKAIADGNVTLHVNMTGLNGLGGFMASAQRGLRAGEAGPATDYEMSMIARALANGQRSWDSVKFYSPSGPDGAMTLDAAIPMPDLSVLKGEDMARKLKRSVIDHCHC
ncbi:polymorphic toxin-type HINT domain-containing protein [Streptomyces virginiae]|uniref:polymorphic toxin-type HINT domain-containing protein n=1 Tax=Streptomyces virginiae TaxID=1961 RepID=UPI0022574631|nr:polymorphic toxin-type HINT domain-containing protein [Streptomyces virginiae]MCX5271010.1 polymorphic toxin-type HINT domain-containing protein [Streptomyces virginiae]